MNLTLQIFFLLLKSSPMDNRETASSLHTNIRNVQRIIGNISTAFASKSDLTYYFTFKSDKHKHTIKTNMLLNEEEILLLTKILVASRALNKKELPKLANRMIDMIGNENHSGICERKKHFERCYAQSMQTRDLLLRK